MVTTRLPEDKMCFSGLLGGVLLITAGCGVMQRLWPAPDATVVSASAGVLCAIVMTHVVIENSALYPVIPALALGVAVAAIVGRWQRELIIRRAWMNTAGFAGMLALSLTYSYRDRVLEVLSISPPERGLDIQSSWRDFAAQLHDAVTGLAAFVGFGC